MKTCICLLISLFCLCTIRGMAQGSLGGRNKAVYLEGLGSGLLLSVNYDFRFRNTQDGLGMRIGVGGLSVAATATNNNGTTSPARLGVVTMPILLNYLVGKGRVAFEMGAGVTPIYLSATKYQTNNEFVQNSNFGVLGTLNAGLRVQPIRNGVVFRLDWTPMISDTGFQPAWAGVSLGYAFK
ncbi:hypothetical protein [Fibrella aquatilis]|uniref:Outer membrane protein beta-barrel domain-containing protein n=1 Tax=Fibrella aquatilis TaxID=2817059 RepID=A0A939G9L0_9BACT|nr:hypothetical protein [Fibrella aquatilis]MBO0932835.1 hypothetical protein [Fibrella aquatilis]